MPESGGEVLCLTCEGRGFLGYDVPIDDPRFGTLTPCPCCQPSYSLVEAPTSPAEGLPSPAWTLTQGDAIDYPCSGDFLHFYAHQGLTRHQPWMDAPLPGEAASIATQRRADTQIEADSHRLSQIPLAQILRPVQTREKPPASLPSPPGKRPPRMTRPKA